MTRLFNEPDQFVSEAMAGFAAANGGRVSLVEGGVVRSQLVDERVALIIGGGSGHYPAFAGLVGPGIATGAAVGNVFASPSTQQICSVARAAETGKGVLFSFGNYTGDLLNFTAAKDQLEQEGISCRVLAVTDDVASASVEEASKRRGVAGGFIVYKMAGRAADEGRSLDEVTRIAELANDRTRSLGVAFSGCSLPGSDSPLFTLPDGRMSVGMGVHGEPGISEQALPSANELAEILVARLLDEVPPGVEPAGSSVALVLNGLGSVKYEELFVVYRRVDELFRDAAVQIVAPEVGEFTTSFDMAGVSLTACWLTDQLTELWLAPASTPAFKRGDVRWVGGTAATERRSSVTTAIAPASAVSREAGIKALAGLEAASAALSLEAGELGRLDAIAGDGDHGLGMKRGAAAAVEAARMAVDASAGVGTVLERAGESWAAAGGGTSGALWGVLLRAIGNVLGDASPVGTEEMARASSQAAGAVQRVGGAKAGDKSMLDVLAPIAESLTRSAAMGSSLTSAWREAAAIASLSAEATADMTPKVGRARPLGDRSLGTPDPGAVSLALVMNAAASVLASDESLEAKGES